MLERGNVTHRMKCNYHLSWDGLKFEFVICTLRSFLRLNCRFCCELSPAARWFCLALSFARGSWSNHRRSSYLADTNALVMLLFANTLRSFKRQTFSFRTSDARITCQCVWLHKLVSSTPGWASSRTARWFGSAAALWWSDWKSRTLQHLSPWSAGQCCPTWGFRADFECTLPNKLVWNCFHATLS